MKFEDPVSTRPEGLYILCGLGASLYWSASPLRDDPAFPKGEKGDEDLRGKINGEKPGW